MTPDVDTQSVTVATQLIGLDAKWLQPFDVEDPFNNNLRLRGFLCQKPDHRYGALVITHAGEAVVPQLILATPKLHYPFGKDGSFQGMLAPFGNPTILFPPQEARLTII